MSQVAATYAEDDAILQRAAEILQARMVRHGSVSDPCSAADYLGARIGGLAYEAFHVLFLDVRHCVVAFETLFTGTIDSAEVHPREVVRRALAHNAHALILAHNHPSGQVEPSTADIAITRRLREALELINVRVLDHLIVAGGLHLSMASRGLL